MGWSWYYPVYNFSQKSPLAGWQNKELVSGATVYLEKDVSETDRFDRLLRYVWWDDGE